MTRVRSAAWTAFQFLFNRCGFLIIGLILLKIFVPEGELGHENWFWLVPNFWRGAQIRVLYHTAWFWNFKGTLLIGIPGLLLGSRLLNKSVMFFIIRAFSILIFWYGVTFAISALALYPKTFLARDIYAIISGALSLALVVLLVKKGKL